MTIPQVDDYVLIPARLGKRRNPHWLAAWQDRMRRATRIAAEETEHLHGAERQKEMSRLIGQMMRAPQATPYASE